jgi:tRNA A-37 threonylcarbamoyl transferase component Bud32
VLDNNRREIKKRSYCVSSTGITIKDQDYHTTRGQSGSQGLSEHSKNTTYNKFMQWTSKMSTLTCGAAEQLQNVDQTTRDYSQSTDKSKLEKPPRQKNMEKGTSSFVISESNKLRGHDVSIYPSKSSRVGSRDGSRDDHDHHTFATATTASATISFSHSDVNSIASEAGMEVVMSSNDSEMEVASPVEEYKTHSFPAGKHTFTVDKRYSMIRVVGSGAYGVVISAKESKKTENVAIKMVPKAFNDEIDAKRILREIKLLKHFQHENIVGVVDMMPPTARHLEDFHDVYIVTDLMETDLHRIIYSKQKLSVDHAQYFIYQLLRGLKYIHSADVIHRDLKPSNLLVNSNCDLKICDFGLARGVGENRICSHSMVSSPRNYAGMP